MSAVPSVHHRAAITWLSVYAMIMLVQVVIGPVLAPLPLPLRTLVLTAIVVPAVVYALVPNLLRVHARLRRSHRLTASDDA
ncbi:hypothetical protein ACFYY8_05530 [Streptosporangium sp. NPDC001559]|uniref:hypothetical protein n=1 Tax=Streptosporangium sp. NPDC001559 TaxID=3366187 RepID=UPI0036E6410E